MNDPIHLLGIVTTALELFAVTLSFICVALNIRQLHWAWLFAIASSAAYGVVFYYSNLFGSMGLQVVFIVVSVWGWYQWLHGSAQHDALAVTKLNRAGWGYAASGWLSGFVVIAILLAGLTNTDVPYIDSFLAAGSLVGQVLLSRKKMENWIVWIIVNILYVGHYLSAKLTLTAILYAMFVVMAVIGLYTWRRDAGRKAA